MRTPRSYRALQSEMIVTQMVVSMTIMSLFFNDIGLSQAQVGITQAIFTIILVVFNVPLGKLADRFSRKGFNIFGDLMAAVGFAWYATAASFGDAIFGEILIGFGLAMSLGVDGALMQGYCNRFNLDFSKESSKVHTIGPILAMAGMIIAGLLGSINLRIPLAMDAVVFATGAVLSLFIRDYNAKMPSNISLRQIIVASLRTNKRLAARITSLAIVRESTHAIIWLVALVIVDANGPVWLVGIAWALMVGSRSIGGRLSKALRNLPTATRLAVPLGMMGVASLLCISNAWPVIMVGIAIIGAGAGYVKAVNSPILAEASDPTMLTTVTSIGATSGHVIYVIAVLGVNWIADIWSARAGFVVNALVFILAGIIALRRLTKNN